MGRPSLPPGSWGEFNFDDLENSSVRLTVYYARLDGKGGRLRLERKTRAEARRVARERLPQLIEQRDAKSPISGSTRLRDVVEKWIELENFTEAKVESTRHENERLARANILPMLGDRRVSEITPLVVQDFYQHHAERTPRQADTIRGVLSQIMDLAVVNEALLVNPVLAVKRKKRAPKEIFAPTRMELDDLRDIVERYNLREDRRGPRPSRLLLDVIETILGTGARIGEACGLRWEDIDLLGEKPSVTIRGTVIEGKGQVKHYQPDTKTPAGIRKIFIAPRLVSILRHRRLMSAGNEFVFATRSGLPNGPQDVHRALRRVREWAGITDEMVPHALRKSVLTAIAEEEGIEAAAKVAGHKQATVTERFYVKPSLETPDVTRTLRALGE